MHLKNYQLPDIAASQVARYLCYFEIDGELVDITPQMSRAKALFIAVPNMTLPPAKLRYNRRMPLTTDPLVLRYIELATIRDIGYLHCVYLNAKQR